ncbi:hypothetical protein LOAG_18236 [Loa loa]|uniref:Uncharacterized protein n=1 Tax=Loa loa TaxID=7209 RepID=A0A1S0UGF4_LOALO|nr:hypothetical protein LOAG_18236 [Loa loa]EJD74448.1 hypothetical protein LOAG_18236 [Loa loa]
MISNSSMENSLTFIETSTITPNVASDEAKRVEGITTVVSYETKLTNSTAKVPMAVFNITVRPPLINAKFLSHFNKTSNIYKYLLLDEVGYMEANGSEASDSSNIVFSIDDKTTSLNDLANDANEIHNDLYSDDSLSLTDDIVVDEEFKLGSSTMRNLHEIHLQPKTETTLVFNGTMQADTVTNHARNTEDHHRNLFSANNPIVSHDFEGLKEESDGKISDNQGNSRTKNTNITVSQTIDPIKSDFTTRTMDENFNAQIMLRVITPKTLTTVDNQSNTLPLNISVTSAPEIEEIATVNKKRKKIIHQTSTILKAEKPTGNDSSLSFTSIIPHASTSTSKLNEQNTVVILSSDQTLLHQLSIQSDLQSQNDQTTTVSHANEEMASIKDRNNANIVGTLQTSQSSSMIVQNSFFQQKSTTNGNDITSIDTIISNDDAHDDAPQIDHLTFNTISSSATSFQDSLTENSRTNGKSSQSSFGISTNNKFHVGKAIINDLINDENSQQSFETSTNNNFFV